MSDSIFETNLLHSDTVRTPNDTEYVAVKIISEEDGTLSENSFRTVLLPSDTVGTHDTEYVAIEIVNEGDCTLSENSSGTITDRHDKKEGMFKKCMQV